MLYTITMNRLNLFDTMDKMFTLNMNNMLNNRHRSEEPQEGRLKETDNEYKISFNLAGTKKEDIRISYEQDNELLCVTTEEEIPYHYRVYIAKDIDAHKTKAKYENGILSLIIPKSEKSKPVLISVD